MMTTTPSLEAQPPLKLVVPFHEEEYKQKLLDKTLTLRLSYREVTDEATTELLTYSKPSLARLLLTHHSILSQLGKELAGGMLAARHLTVAVRTE